MAHPSTREGRSPGDRPSGDRPGKSPFQTRSLRALSGTALMTLRAGLALIVIGWPLNGLTPCLALVAGLSTTLSLSRPGTTKIPGPFLPRSLAIDSLIASKTSEICFLLSPVFSARTPKISDLVAGLAFGAADFSAFLAAGAGAGAALGSAAFGAAFLAMGRVALLESSYA